MPIAIAAPRILVKARTGLSMARFALGATTHQFTASPLFHSIGSAQGIVPPSTWYVLTPTVALDGGNPWDLCHALMQDGLGVEGAPAPEFAEPDFQQRWIVGRDSDNALALARGCGEAAPPDNRFPAGPAPLWFHASAYAGFDDALAYTGIPAADVAVRVAHLDTGYDPNHHSLPERLEEALQRNFVDSDRPDDASDDTLGPLNNLGHGTGTLSILAGKTPIDNMPMGAAPFVRVVPIRVADRVVLFYNSAIARAFDYVHGLCRDPAARVDVVTMSMGGLASQAWADAVNALYEAGVFVVTAAGNNFGNLPTRNIVFPARFHRVVAACGVMADDHPYADLPLSEMAGNYGPTSKMGTAIAAYTPNVPWAKLGCAEIVDFDGAGTSAATPQVAAAAAIWIQHNKQALAAYSEPWMRVEAVRKALFSKAKNIDATHLGRGELRAREALDEPAAAGQSLKMEKRDSASFPILRILTGLGVAETPGSQQQMLELEALQLSQSASFEGILPDPSVDPQSLSSADRLRIADALANHPLASRSLREALGQAARRGTRSVSPWVNLSNDAVQALHLEHATRPEIAQPPRRRLRVFAYDPSIGTRIETLGINEAVLDIPWEPRLQPGPIGEYLEVVDVDPSSGCCYAPVDLNDPRLLAQNGLPPAEANPQFHQQMAYAVAMRTIEHFERALGRVALWAPRRIDSDGQTRDNFVRRLRIYPHAIRAANAFYSPDRKALLFGYFNAADQDAGDVLPGGLVFGALSHDILAHETTHALLDGLHRRFREPTNPDVLAFHEAFADIVALFQHFTLPEALRQQIAKTRGDLAEQNLLAKLAVEFGQATRMHGALRDAIGKIENGEWKQQKPSRQDYEKETEAHARGAVLVAAVFGAFVQIYQARTADLVRLATGGSGVLPAGALPADLVERLAREASKVAGQVLNICIRALDYCPPVDITFGEYLRALITADRDVVPDDRKTYRVAFVSAFRDRGIYPADVRSLSIGSLVWEPPPLPLKNIGNVLRKMALDWDLKTERERAYRESRENAQRMNKWLKDETEVAKDQIDALGLSRRPGSMKIGNVQGELRPIEVHSVRPARRVGPDGTVLSDLVIEITQTFRPVTGGRFRGGCTLLIDLKTNEVRYFIRKKVDSAPRLAAQQAFAGVVSDPLRATYFEDPDRGAEPFALLHRGY